MVFILRNLENNTSETKINEKINRSETHCKINMDKLLKPGTRNNNYKIVTLRNKRF